MATKSQLYRAEQERARQQHPTATPHHHDPRLTHDDAAKTDSTLRITARLRDAAPEAHAGRKSSNPM
jgi:hypothetical protein